MTTTFENSGRHWMPDTKSGSVTNSAYASSSPTRIFAGTAFKKVRKSEPFTGTPVGLFGLQRKIILKKVKD